MKNMTMKTFIQMIIVMLIILFIYFFTAGFFRINSTFADIFSMSSKQTIAKSDNWELCIPEKDGLEPYFTHTGTKDIYTYIIGKIYYTTNGNDEIKTMDIEYHSFSDRHFFIGERRWYLYRCSDKNIVKVSFKITWKEYGEVFNEYISSNNLTTEEIQQANKWIETYDEGYTYPPLGYRK